MVTYIFVGIGALLLLIFLLVRDEKSSAIAVCIKSLVSICFIITALVAISENPNPDAPLFTIISISMVGGLVFGLFGDYTLDLKIYFKSLRNDYKNAEKDSSIMTYFGIGAFGIGHIFYISATALRYPEQLISLLYSAILAIGLAVVIVFVGGKLTKLHYGKLLIPCLIYCYLLVWFLALALLMTIYDPKLSNILRLVGAISFLISDLFLSITYFSIPEKRAIKGHLNPESRLMIILNHGTYFFAQFIIAVSLLYP